MSNTLQAGSGSVKICHISTVHRRDDARILFRECVSLAERFRDITLVVFDGKGDDWVAGVAIVDLGMPPGGRLLRMLAGLFKVLRHPGVGSASVIHFHDPELLIAGLMLKLRGQKAIYDAHEDVPRQIENKHWIPARLRRFVGWLVEGVENFVARRLDAVVAATPLIRDRFAKVNSQATTVRNYPLLGEFLNEPLDKPLSRDICYVGALTRERGIVELLDALVELGSARLIACGPFQSAAFEAELRRHPGWVFVDYLGIVGRQEVAKVMGRAQIGMVTLLPTPNQVEALPVKMFEYMASGTPFLASDFPLWRRIADDSQGGRCVDPTNPRLIAAALSEMLNDRSGLRALGAAGRAAAVSRYNWLSESEQLLGLYESMLRDEEA